MSKEKCICGNWMRLPILDVNDLLLHRLFWTNMKALLRTVPHYSFHWSYFAILPLLRTVTFAQNAGFPLQRYWGLCHGNVWRSRWTSIPQLSRWTQQPTHLYQQRTGPRNDAIAPLHFATACQMPHSTTEVLPRLQILALRVASQSYRNIKSQNVVCTYRCFVWRR